MITLNKSQPSYSDVFNKGATCLNGRLQSPIELSDDGSTYSEENLLTSINYKSISNSYLYFNERVLKVYQTQFPSANFGSVIYKKRGFISQFELIDIEIYYPAEHRIKIGTQTKIPDIEVKLIHRKNNNYFTSINSNRNFNEPNSYLIISLLYSANANESDNGFLTNMNMVYNPSKSDTLIKTLDLPIYDLVRNNQYYMYDGSFSYYPCDENVSYIVVKNIFSINNDDLSTIISRYSGKWPNGTVNKLVAGYYGRPIYRNFMTTSGSILKSSGIIIALIYLFLILI